MGVNTCVLRIILKQNLNCYWTRSADLSLERISSIDLRSDEAAKEFPICVVVPAGVYVQRAGYLAKLIPWSNIDDLDIDGDAPGFDRHALAEEAAKLAAPDGGANPGTDPAGSALAPPLASPAAKAANPAMPTNGVSALADNIPSNRPPSTPNPVRK